ncbi:hypothetical protein OAB57_01410 [Bacteriovoracaceae bacterium]|nr:hypothetical protein [Bacteriovoracaceae bacterium]
MKYAIISMLFLCQSWAITIKVLDPCNGEVVVQEEVPIDSSSDVGTLTINFLNKHQIPFSGTNRGMNSILNTPTGMESIDTLSDHSLLAFGQCFKLDGMIPNTMPHETTVLDEHQNLAWYYGYTGMLNGEWGEPCIPAWEAPTEAQLYQQFCNNRD